MTPAPKCRLMVDNNALRFAWWHTFYFQFTDTTDPKMLQHFVELLKEFPKARSMWIGPIFSFVILTHPDTITPILKSSAPKYVDEMFAPYALLVPWIGKLYSQQNVRMRCFNLLGLYVFSLLLYLFIYLYKNVFGTSPNIYDLVCENDRINRDQKVTIWGTHEP